MTDAELLKRVKSSLGITGTYQDETLSNHIDEAKFYLCDAGVSKQVIDSDASVGVIVRGVSDLWNYGMGDGKLSEYFYQRAIQLRLVEVVKKISVQSTPGKQIGATVITVADRVPGTLYRYSFTDELPKLNEDLADWFAWDGNSEIFGEDGHKICVVEVTSESLALKAGITTISVNLG